MHARARFSAGFLGLFCALAAPLSGQSRKLNGPMAPLPDADGAARIFGHALSPGGQRVVWRGDHDLSGIVRLYSAPRDGSAPAVQLADTGVTDFKISPTGAYVAFRSPPGIYSVPIDGSAIPVLIAPSSPGSPYEFTPDGTQLVCNRGGLAAVPVTGGPALHLGNDAYALALSPDGTLVVFQERHVEQGGLGDIITDELLRVPLDGSAVPTRLNVLGPGQYESEMQEFQLSPDGKRALYWSRLDGGEPELSSVRLDTTPSPVQLTHFAYGQHGAWSTISADSSLVVYAASIATPGALELYRVPIGGGPAIKLNGPLVDGGSVAGKNEVPYRITADDRFVVYRADQEVDGTFRLHVVPLRGNTPLWRIDSPGVGRFALTADGQHVVFEATDDPLDRFRQLYGARIQPAPHAHPSPVRALDTAVCLNRAMFEYGGLETFALAPDSQHVVYTAAQDSYAVELYGVDVEGALPPVQLSAPLVEGGGVSAGFRIDPASQWVVYRSDQETDELFELFAVPIDGSAAPLRLNPPLPPSPTVGYVRAFYLEPDGQHVLFEGSGGRAGIDELYRVPLAGGPPHARVNHALPPTVEVLFAQTKTSPDGRWVVYGVARSNEFQYPELRSDLYAVDLAAGGPPLRLTGNLPGTAERGFEISADSARVVFIARNLAGQRQVHVVPIDGSAPALELSSLLIEPTGFKSFHLTPGGGRVVFTGRELAYSGRELFSAPLDGSAPSVRLSGSLASYANVEERPFGVQTSPGATWVAYLADVQENERHELWSVPTDGSAAPLRLNKALVDQGDVYAFRISGPRAVYLADEEVDGRLELYSTPLAAPPLARGSNGTTCLGRVKLNGPFAAGNPGVLSYLLTPQGDRVVYLAQQLGSTSIGIYTVAADGTGQRRRLASNVVELMSWRVTPDGQRVVYTLRRPGLQPIELWSLPLDGSAGARKLNADLPPGGSLLTFDSSFQISPDSGTVVYLADQTVDERFELYAVDVAGTQPPVVLNGPLVPGGDVGGPFLPSQPAFPVFQFTPDGSEVVYLADQERDEIVELFASPVP